MDLKETKLAIQSNNFRITLHALKELEADDITIKELKKSIASAEIIEDYSYSKPMPSCLMLSFDNVGPIHSVWAHDESSSRFILVTAYRPNPKKWVEYKLRR